VLKCSSECHSTPMMINVSVPVLWGCHDGLVTLLASVQLYRWSPKDASYFTVQRIFSSNFAARQPGIAKCNFLPKSQILTKKRMTARLSIASGCNDSWRTSQKRDF
jgi:hypothetical protein